MLKVDWRKHKASSCWNHILASAAWMPAELALLPGCHRSVVNSAKPGCMMYDIYMIHLFYIYVVIYFWSIIATLYPDLNKEHFGKEAWDAGKAERHTLSIITSFNIAAWFDTVTCYIDACNCLRLEIKRVRVCFPLFSTLPALFPTLNLWMKVCTLSSNFFFFFLWVHIYLLN